MKIFNAFKQLPWLHFPKEAAGGDATGVYWCPTSRDPATERRSYAKTGHYDNGAAQRPNFHLFPGHRVTQVILSEDNKVAEGVRITPRDGPMPDTAWEVKAKREIVLSAGSVHTPQVLQRSGIGPRHILEAAGAVVRVELPGVGYNLQDHMNFGIGFTCGLLLFFFPPWASENIHSRQTGTKETFPNSTTLATNETFAAEALALWNANKTGITVIPTNLFQRKL